MLKITRVSNLNLKTFKADDNKIVIVGCRANKTVVKLFKNNKLRNLTYMPNLKAIKKHIFLIPNTKKTFNYLK